MVRARRSLAVLACAVSLLSACGGDGGGGGDDEAAEEKVVPAAVQELVVGYNKDPGSTPPRATASASPTTRSTPTSARPWSR